jgi:hypothetical protein
MFLVLVVFNAEGVKRIRAGQGMSIAVRSQIFQTPVNCHHGSPPSGNWWWCHLLNDCCQDGNTIISRYILNCKLVMLE